MPVLVQERETHAGPPITSLVFGGSVLLLLLDICCVHALVVSKIGTTVMSFSNVFKFQTNFILKIYKQGPLLQ